MQAKGAIAVKVPTGGRVDVPGESPRASAAPGKAASPKGKGGKKAKGSGEPKSSAYAHGAASLVHEHGAASLLPPEPLAAIAEEPETAEPMDVSDDAAVAAAAEVVAVVQGEAEDVLPPKRIPTARGVADLRSKIMMRGF